MRILFGGDSLADPRGGGELSARALLACLSASHHVEAVGAARTPRTYEIGAVRCRNHAVRGWPPPPGLPFHLGAVRAERGFRPALVAAVRQLRPDLVILQQPACLWPHDLPTGTRLVVFVRSLVCYGAADANPSRWRRVIGRPFRAMRFRRNRPLLERADLIVSNSRFLQAALERRAGIRSVFVPPFIDSAALRTTSTGGRHDAITFVGLDAWKGAAVAMRLAAALPARRFLFLEGPRVDADLSARARRLPNVECLPWTDDMGAVFARTRLLLVPSLWEEPFGRLPVEAGACGVPSLASARGGLREAVGPGGIVIDSGDDLASWIDAIRRLDDPALYASVSAAARRHADALGLEATFGRFRDLVRRMLAIEL